MPLIVVFWAEANAQGNNKMRVANAPADDPERYPNTTKERMERNNASMAKASLSTQDDLLHRVNPRAIALRRLKLLPVFLQTIGKQSEIPRKNDLQSMQKPACVRPCIGRQPRIIIHIDCKSKCER